jgi:hypothetical protein
MILIIVLRMEVCFVENRTILVLMPFSTRQRYVYNKFNIAITKTEVLELREWYVCNKVMYLTGIVSARAR